MRISDQQRSNILRAAADARARGPLDTAKYDAVDLASDTSNYWWNGLDNDACAVGLRLVALSLRQGPR